jgi:hypothetical protein
MNAANRDGKTLNLQKLNNVKVKEKHQTKISQSSVALENLEDNELQGLGYC